jgi:hypothetical protein
MEALRKSVAEASKQKKPAAASGKTAAKKTAARPKAKAGARKSA